MILTNTNINTLPFYATLAEQSHKDSWASQLEIGTPYNQIPTFQLICTDTTTVPVLELYDRNDVKISTIVNAETGLASKGYGPYRVVYNKSLVLTNLLPNYDCYLKLTIGTFVYYSDLMTPTDISTALKLEYWNLTDIDYGDYKIYSGTSGVYFPFRIYLDSDIGKPLYPYIDDVTDRMGIEFINHMITKKTFKFGFWTNEQQFDGLRICRISDKIAITYKGKLYPVIKIDFSEIEWRGDGLGWVECEFEVDSIMNKFPTAIPTRGDFNDDYSDDFFNT